MMNQKKASIICLVVTFFLFVLPFAQAGNSNDFSEKLNKINAAGFVLLAEIDGKSEVVDSAREFESLISDGKQPVFYLLHKESGKKFKVEMEYGTKKHPGEYVWEFYEWVVSLFEK